MTINELITRLEMYNPELPVQIERIAPGGIRFHDNVVRVSRVNYTDPFDKTKDVILFVPEVFAAGKRQYGKKETDE